MNFENLLGIFHLVYTFKLLKPNPLMPGGNNKVIHT